MSATLRVGACAPDHPRLPRPARLRAVLPGLRLALPLLPQPELIEPRGAEETLATPARLPPPTPGPVAGGGLQRRRGDPTGSPSATPCARSANWASASALTAPASTPRLRPGAGAERLGGLRRQGAGRGRRRHYRRGRQRRGPTGAAWNACWTAAWPTNAGPRCTGACSIANASGAWRCACARWAWSASPYNWRARPASSIRSFAKPAPQGAAQLWRELEELFPPSNCATPEPPVQRRRSGLPARSDGRAVPTRPALHKTHTIVREHLLDS